jgi:hypothetical protein
LIYLDIAELCSTVKKSLCALTQIVGRAMAQAVSRRPLTVAARVRARVNAVGFVVNKVELGQVFLRVLRFFPVSSVGSTFSKIKKNSSFTHPFHSPLHSFSSGDEQ